MRMSAHFDFLQNSSVNQDVDLYDTNQQLSESYAHSSKSEMLICDHYEAAGASDVGFEGAQASIVSHSQDHFLDRDYYSSPLSDSSENSEINGYETDTHDSVAEQLCTKLAEWAVNYQIPQTAVSSLLSVLRNYHPGIPMDARTLLKTPRQCNVKEISGGSYYHFGVEKSLVRILSTTENMDTLKDSTFISLQVNIDGLPLFKSSNIQFWPILARINNPLQSSPFIIGLFCGNHKPENIDEFLKDFVSEMKVIDEQGIEIEGLKKKLGVNIACFICDAPARSFVKQIKGHNSYYGCEKCKQKGSWMGRIVFPSLNAPARTDDDFDTMVQEEHHNARSPLIDLGIKILL